MFRLVPRWIVGLIGVTLVATGIALGAHFATQADDGSPTIGEEPTPPPTPIPRRSAPDLAPSPPPTRGPQLTPEPATPQPGVCPPPVRQTPEDFPEPPPAIEPPGRHVEGGTSFAEGYVTVHLPAGRQFIIQTGWSTDADGVYIAIYDVQAQSPMIIRGDGCETWRLVRDPAADVVFDEIMATLEVGDSYACPSPGRVTPEDFPGTEKAPSLSQIGGQSAKGGAPLRVGDLTLQLPADREFRVGGGVSSPGGSFLWVYDIETQSYLYLRPDGCETSRFIRDGAADAVFDQIVATLEVED